MNSWTVGGIAAAALVAVVLYRNRNSSNAVQYGPADAGSSGGSGAVPSGSFKTAAGMVIGDFDPILGQVSAYYGIPYKRIVAHIMVESWGDPAATGKAGERGLMQLMPGALSDVKANYPLNFTWNDMYVASPNIQVGTAYLALQLSRLNDLNLASRAYNAGAGAVRQNPEVAQDYLNKILDAEQKLTAMGVA